MKLLTLATGIMVLMFLLAVPGQRAHTGKISATGREEVSAAPGDHRSVLLNPAGLADADKFTAGLQVSSNYHIPGLYQGVVSAAHTFRADEGWGAGIEYFAHEHYHIEQNWRLAYGRRLFDNLSAGVAFDLLHRSLYQQENNILITGEAGILLDLPRDLRLGITVFNPAGLKMPDDDRMPPYTCFTAAVDYTFSKSLSAGTHLRIQTAMPVSSSVAVSYAPTDQLKLNKGVSLSPFAQYFSVYFSFMNIRTGVAFEWHPYLWFSSHAGLDFMGAEYP